VRRFDFINANGSHFYTNINSINHPSSMSCLFYTWEFSLSQEAKREKLHNAGECFIMRELYRRFDLGSPFRLWSEGKYRGLLELLEELRSGTGGCAMGEVEKFFDAVLF